MEHKPTKYLLTGKNGQVGFELQRALAPLGELVTIDQEDCDLQDHAKLRSLIQEIRPEVVVHPAAYTAVDRAETEHELAFSINRDSTRVIGQEAEKLDALVIYYSTDYVFDGMKKESYSESDEPNPLSIYGKSKLAGEQELRESGTRYIILRTSWVVGAHGHNFLKTILRLAKEKTELSIVEDQYGAPTSAALIADVTAHILFQVGKNNNDQRLNNLYHLTANGRTNWHEYACYIIEKAKNADIKMNLALSEVKAIKTDEYPLPAQRPENSCLNTNKLSLNFGLHLPNWQIGLDHILQQIF